MQAASGLPTVSIIFAAQVINGLLLPFLTICLTLCLQDQVQSGYTSTGGMLLATFVTLFLAIHLVAEQSLNLLDYLTPPAEPEPEPEPLDAPEPEPEPPPETESAIVTILVSGSLALLGTLVLAVYLVLRTPKADAALPPPQAKPAQTSPSDSDGERGGDGVERGRRQSMNG